MKLVWIFLRGEEEGFEGFGGYNLFFPLLENDLSKAWGD